jgi:uncharacterized protein (TIGR03382 family)
MSTLPPPTPNHPPRAAQARLLYRDGAQDSGCALHSCHAGRACPTDCAAPDTDGGPAAAAAASAFSVVLARRRDDSSLAARSVDGAERAEQGPAAVALCSWIRCCAARVQPRRPEQDAPATSVVRRRRAEGAVLPSVQGRFVARHAANPVLRVVPVGPVPATPPVAVRLARTRAARAFESASNDRRFGPRRPAQEARPAGGRAVELRSTRTAVRRCEGGWSGTSSVAGWSLW